jgi:hypothetical protein
MDSRIAAIGINAAVDVQARDLGRRDAAQVEQRERRPTALPQSYGGSARLDKALLPS